MAITADLPYQRIQVVVNPAAGQDRPILGPMNTIFHQAGVDWDVSITKKAGDAQRLTREAVAAGVDAVAVYGGDGTVTEVASALVGTQVPLAIFPGGTANVMSVELGIPSDLAEAIALVCSDEHEIRQVDMGQVMGDRKFLLRVGVGVEAEMVVGADREAKDRLGWLAYVVSGLNALREPQLVQYHLTLDGLQVERQGLTCIITNAGNLGLPGFSLSPIIDIGDGLLDVIVISQADLGSLLSVAASVVIGTENSRSVEHWQVRQVSVVADPPQSVEGDGEDMGQTPIEIEVLPRAVRIIVPRQDAELASAAA